LWLKQQAIVLTSRPAPEVHADDPTTHIFSGGKLLAEHDDNFGVASVTREYIYARI
jgi:hypothetical protein